MIFWDALLELKSELDNSESLPSLVYICFSNSKKVTFTNSEGNADIRLDINTKSDSPLSSKFFKISLVNDSNLNKEEIRLFKLYFPYTCLKHFSKSRGKCFAISHFAQSLDGRIATSTGNSKWIGNEENLIHAHRMRALCDGILVGSKTLEIDKPRLNVRRVRGKNPTKVIIGGNSELQKADQSAIDADTIVFKENSIPGEVFKCIELPKNPLYNVTEILKALAEYGIHSVYIEGGSFTTSSFLKQKELDQIQLHFSNKIIGSGISAFVIDGISNISEAITFAESEYYMIGDEMMFVGNTVQ